MNALPEGNKGKAAALAILAVVVASLYFAVLSPVLAFYDNNAQRLEERHELLRRYQNAVNDLPRLRSVAKQRTQPDNTADLLPGASDSIAAAALQSTLKDLIEDEGAKITSATMLAPAVEDNFRRVGVRIAFSGDLQLLTTVLLGIQVAHPALFVGNLDLRVAGDSDNEASPNLTIALDVSGYRAR